MGRIKKQDKGKSNLRAEEDFSEKVESMNLDPRLTKLIHKYQEVFGALPPPLSCKKVVQMDLKLKPEFEGSVVRRRPYPAPQDQIDEIERQIQECIDAGLVEEYKHGDVSAASPICSDFQTFCPDWLHFGHFLCFGGIAASQLSHRIFPIYF